MGYTPLAASSIVLLVIAGMTASQRLVPEAPPKPLPTAQLMARYEKAILLLKEGKAEQALRSIASDPDEVLVVATDLQQEHLPAVTFLLLGCTLTNQARTAAQQGDVALSQSLLEACHDLSQRLQRNNNQETPEERHLRRSVADRLEGLAARTALEVG